MKIYELTINGHKHDFSEDQLSLIMVDIKQMKVGETAKIKVIDMAGEVFDRLPEFQGS